MWSESGEINHLILIMIIQNQERIKEGVGLGGSGMGVGVRGIKQIYSLMYCFLKYNATLYPNAFQK